jgi:hypothetical protein
MVDVSLGVMRNGIGSMSKEDAHYVVEDQQQIKFLKEAAENGRIVKFTFDEKRFVFCTDTDKFIKSVEYAKD